MAEFVDSALGYWVTYTLGEDKAKTFGLQRLLWEKRVGYYGEVLMSHPAPDRENLHAALKECLLIMYPFCAF